MTIVVSGMKNKALCRLLTENEKKEKDFIDFIGGHITEDNLIVDVFFTDTEWKVTTGKCNDTEFVELKTVAGEERFMFVLTAGEFDSITIS